MTKRKLKRKVGWNEAIIQLFTLITCISIVWAINFPFYQDKGFLIDLIFTIIFGVGGIGFYIPIARQIGKAFEEEKK